MVRTTCRKPSIDENHSGFHQCGLERCSSGEIIQVDMMTDEIEKEFIDMDVIDLFDSQTDQREEPVSWDWPLIMIGGFGLFMLLWLLGVR